MSGFDERQQGFEKKFAHDAELEFKAAARRNKLLGLWAAEQFGLEGDAAQDYAKTVVKADLEEPGDEDVFRKVRADLDERRVDLSDQALREKMAELMGVAITQIQSERE